MADVDNLGGGKDHPHIDVSETVLCFCTKFWFTNPPCMRELVRAVLRKKPLIALLEADTSDIKGGHTETECRKILLDEYDARLADWARKDQQLETWAKEWGMPDLKMPTGKEIVDALFESPPIVWFRLTDFQDVTMRLIAERIVFPEARHGYDDKYKQRAYLDGERSAPTSQEAIILPTLREGREYHLYCSERNGPACDLAKYLKDKMLPDLMWTSDPSKIEACEHIQVHLTNQTWTRGEESEAFVAEVATAMRAGIHRMLVHEVPSARERDHRHACSFEQLIQATPQNLKDARLYNVIAMNLGADEWLEAGIVRLAQLLSKDNGVRKPVEVRGAFKAAVAVSESAGDDVAALKMQLIEKARQIEEDLAQIEELKVQLRASQAHPHIVPILSPRATASGGGAVAARQLGTEQQRFRNATE